MQIFSIKLWLHASSRVTISMVPLLPDVKAHMDQRVLTQVPHHSPFRETGEDSVNTQTFKKLKCVKRSMSITTDILIDTDKLLCCMFSLDDYLFTIFLIIKLKVCTLHIGLIWF